MLYKLLKIFAKLFIKIYCRKIKINKKELLQLHGPVLLAANHPNSFLDAVILATLFKAPVFSLARGDAFKTKPIAAILNYLNILPVYRQRDGAKNLHRNYNTFDACIEIFKKNGVVLIFSEALSENEWKLRPLKKGTARLVIAAWQQRIPLKVLPIGINYSSFKLFGKNVDINFGSLIEQEKFNLQNTEPGKLLNDITSNIEKHLQTLVYQIDTGDSKVKKAILSIKLPFYKKLLYAAPALLGFITHAPFYLPLQILICKKYGKRAHYDSILILILFIIYPFYLIFLAILISHLAGGFWWIFTFFTLPFFAWSFMQLNKQIED